MWDDRYRTDRRIKEARGIRRVRSGSVRKIRMKRRKCVKDHLEAARLAWRAIKAHNSLELFSHALFLSSVRCCDITFCLSEGTADRSIGKI